MANLCASLFASKISLLYFTAKFLLPKMSLGLCLSSFKTETTGTSIFNKARMDLVNLIVVDGGTAQINVTKSILALLNIDVPVVSVLKDERHKPKDILGNKNFAVKYKREILLANSEAHRFAIAYHKNVRAKNFFK